MFRDWPRWPGPGRGESDGAASRDIQVKGLFPPRTTGGRWVTTAEPVVISAQQASDIQDQAFHAFQLVRRDYGTALAFHSSEGPHRGHNHDGANSSPVRELTRLSLIARYLETIPGTSACRSVSRFSIT